MVDNRRVLAVKAMYRRKVKGQVMGGSKTGSIVYIEPETTLQHSRELNNLEYEEKDGFACVFVGQPTKLIDKYKLNTNDEG